MEYELNGFDSFKISVELNGSAVYVLSNMGTNVNEMFTSKLCFNSTGVSRGSRLSDFRLLS